MKTSMSRPPTNKVRFLVQAAFATVLTLGAGHTARAAGPAPVGLGAASTFVILTKTGITNVPTSAITGDLGTSPIDSTAITGFSLVLDSTTQFSISSQVTGRIYASDYSTPTPANLTTAVSNMEAAYTDAAGRPTPDFTELYSGDLSGRTLAPGLYKWSTGVLVTTAVTLAGPSGSVWIFQIAGDLTLGSGAAVVLSGGAQANNVFWQVGGGTGVEIGTTAHVEGTILAQKAIHLRTGASLNGRALAQTAVTLDSNTIAISTATNWRTGEADLGSGWKWTSWFGFYNTTNDPWVYHAQHGWLYPYDTGNGSVRFWYFDMQRFVWTSPTAYPFLYRYGADQTWLWYETGSASPRWFYNYASGIWESLP